MPITEKIQINKQCKLILWKITEPLSDLLQLVNLNEEEKEKLQSFGSESRKKEYLATRILVQKALGKDACIKNNVHGKPRLINSDVSISISHTKSYVGILIGKNHELALDMEALSDRVHRIAKRFLSEQELKSISQNKKLIHLYQHWCAKECLIKLYGKKDAHLIDELKIDPFSPTDKSFTGQVCRQDFSRKYTFKHLLFDDHLLVYSVEASQGVTPTRRS